MPTARRAVEEFAQHLAVAGSMGLAASEAVSAAVQHASCIGVDGGKIDVEAEQGRDEVILQVSDPIEGPHVISNSEGVPTGLPLIGMIADRIAVDNGTAGTRVTMIFHLP